MSAVSEHCPTQATGWLSFARWRLALAALRQSIWPDAEQRWLIEAELLIARRGSRYAPPLAIAAAFVVEQSCAAWIGWPVRVGWLFAIAVAVAILSVVSAWVDRQLEKPQSLSDVRFWAIRQTASFAVFQALFCSMSVFLWAPGVEVNHMLLALVLAASLAGAVSRCAAHPATSIAVLSVHSAFLVVPFLLSSAPLDHTIAGLASAFAIVMAMQAFALHGSIKKMATLEHERSGLVEGLRLAKLESDRERARAVTAGRTKTQFLSNMNHELRTPMNAILGFSELITQKSFGSDVDKYAEYAQIIYDSGQHLLTLIDDMLDLAKIEGGKLALRESEVSLAQLMADAFDIYETKAAIAQLSLLRKVEPNLPNVFADERALRQIISNLVSNALKFTPAEGCVTLFARRDGDGRIAFGVDDTGIGIDTVDQPNVFERFGQGRHDVTTADKGTGLGLAVVKGFAEAHDGEVKLESTLGAGTRVTVYLPAERVREIDRLRVQAG